MKGLVVDEKMSNLTCASSEISASTSGTGNDTSGSDLYPQPFLSTSAYQEPQTRKKRSLPGNPGNYKSN